MSQNPLKIQRFKKLLPVILLGFIVLSFWIYVYIVHIRIAPNYADVEKKAIQSVNLLTMWTWLDYGGQYRYSPTGYLMVGMFDYHIYEPIFKSIFSGPISQGAWRLVPVYILLFVLTSVATYYLIRELGLGVAPALIGGLWMGVNKSYSYYFHYFTLFCASLMLIYSILLFIFFIRYNRTRNNRYLIGYYLSLLFTVGAVETWVNLLPALIILSVLFILQARKLDKAIMLNGILAPVIIFCVYFALRYPTIVEESTTVSREAEYVFSYPSASLMIEDIAVNATLHLADVVDAALFPWPMISQAAMGGYNMDVYNSYNQKYTDYSLDHYRIIGDWYAGLLSGILICFTAFLIYRMSARRQVIPEVVLGLMLIYFGFAAHLPIMYRSYFVLPHYASLLGMKHPHSNLGFAIIIAWTIAELVKRIKVPRWQNVFFGLIGIWFLYTHMSKIIIGYQFEHGVFPW